LSPAWTFKAAAAPAEAEADAAGEAQKRAVVPVVNLVMGITLPVALGGDRYRAPRIAILGYNGDFESIVRKHERVRAVFEFCRARAGQLKAMQEASCFAAVDAMTPRLTPGRPDIVSGNLQYAVNSDGMEASRAPPGGGFEPLPGSFAALARQKKEVLA
jgi:hypothetical protein